MAKAFSTLQAKISAERREKVEERIRRTEALMTLHELRRDLRITQQQIAHGMNTAQGEVSKIEKRTDMKISTLGQFVQSLGGRLELRAVFPQRAVTLHLPETETK